MELLNSTFSSALERSLTAVGGSSEHALTKEELRRSCALHCVAAAGGGEAVRIALADPICNFILVDKLMSVDERGAPRGNGEAEYAPGRTAYHQRVNSAESLARLQDYKQATFDPAKIQEILARFAAERARTHGLTHAGSHEPCLSAEWQGPGGEGPDGAGSCFQKGAGKVVQGKKGRSSVQSRMALASRIGDAATLQGLADGASSDDEFSALPVLAAPSPPLAALASFAPDASRRPSAVTLLIEHSQAARWALATSPPPRPRALRVSRWPPAAQLSAVGPSGPSLAAGGEGAAADAALAHMYEAAAEPS